MSTAFAQHFARLLSQRVHEPANLDAHRATLRDLLATNGDPVTLAWDNWRLRVGGESIPATTAGMLDLLSRMAAHGIRELSFGAGTDKAHLLGTVWILGQDPVLGDGGARALSRLAMLGAPTVRMVPVVAPAPTPADVQVPSAAASEPATPPKLALVVDTPAVPAAVVSPPPPVLPAAPPAPAASAAVPSAPLPAAAPQVPVAPSRPAASPIARRFEERETAEVLIARLKAASEPDRIARALDALAAFTELPRKRIADVVTILLALIDAEPRFTDPETKRMFGFAVKRIAKTTTFRAIAAALFASPERHDDYMRIFRHFGDPAADQLIEQLAQADSGAERRVMFDALVELQRGAPTLISLLGDGRWYVVRNAAELLGEMRAKEAEQGLAWLLNHADARVRASATAALGKLETPGARAALRDAMRDSSHDVRLNAVLALANGDKRGIVAQIIQSLGDEQDPDSLRTYMIALARIGTPEAIQYLLHVAEPEKGFFRRKPTPTRVAAVSALGNAETPGAIAAIRALTKDKEREVREAAARALTPPKATAGAGTRKGW